MEVINDFCSLYHETSLLSEDWREREREGERERERERERGGREGEKEKEERREKKHPWGKGTGHHLT